MLVVGGNPWMDLFPWSPLKHLLFLPGKDKHRNRCCLRVEKSQHAPPPLPSASLLDVPCTFHIATNAPPHAAILLCFPQLTEQVQHLEQQVRRLQDQVAGERSRSDRLAEECSSAEQTAAQASVTKAKAEAQAVELGERLRLLERQKSESERQVLEARELLERASRERSVLVDDQARWRQAADAARAELDALHKRHAELVAKHEWASRELDSKESLLGSTSAAAAAKVEALCEERDQLRRSLRDAELRTESARREANDLAAAKAGEQLEQLRHELATTVEQFGQAEAARSKVEERAAEWRRSARKDRERCALYKAQVSLLEDQLRAASEELEVFRQLDIYKTTLHREYFKTRTSKRSSGGVPAGNSTRWETRLPGEEGTASGGGWTPATPARPAEPVVKEISSGGGAGGLRAGLGPNVPTVTFGTVERASGPRDGSPSRSTRPRSAVRELQLAQFSQGLGDPSRSLRGVRGDPGEAPSSPLGAKRLSLEELEVDANGSSSGSSSSSSASAPGTAGQGWLESSADDFLREDMEIAKSLLLGKRHAAQGEDGRR